MSSVLRKYGGERAAAILAAEDGLDWNELTPEDKEIYYSKAYHKKKDKENTRPVYNEDKDKYKRK